MIQEKNLIPIFIAKTCTGREKYIDYLKEKIPNLKISFDVFYDSGINDKSYQNFQQGLKMANENATIQLEDDIILCDDFVNKILHEINKRPNDVIQFFSMRKDDLTIGSRYELGSKFMMCQCFYLPYGMAKEIYNFSLIFNKNRKEKNSPSDPCVAEFLKIKKIKYWVVIPNLVNHRIGISAIDKKRSSNRVSLTFKS